MTAPFEIEEPEPVAWSHLVRVACVRRCGAQTLADPSQLANALCGPCRLAEASVVTTIQRLPAKTPPRMVWSGSGSRGPEDGSERAELVPPEFVCGTLCVHEVPGPVRDLCQVAEDHGWAYLETHSRGGVMGGNGKQLAVADMWVVRFRKPGWMGYAARRGDEWDSVCITGATLPPFLVLGVTDLRQWLADPEGCGAEWRHAIRDRVARQALHKKIVSCPGAPACVPQGPGRVVAPEHTHRADGSIVIKVSRKEVDHA